MKKLFGLVILAPSFVLAWTANVLAQEVTCPPNQFFVMVDKVEIVGDCDMLGVTVRNGNVQAKDIARFRLINSSVWNGDVQTQNVDRLRISGNWIANGNVQVEDSLFLVEVNSNRVDNGNVQVNKSDDVTVAGNSVPNGNIQVEENDDTLVFLNGTALIPVGGDVQVDKNALAIVVQNTASGNIQCTDNTALFSQDNIAGGNDECP